jgi:hypothetical protein
MASFKANENIRGLKKESSPTLIFLMFYLFSLEIKSVTLEVLSLVNKTQL